MFVNTFAAFKAGQSVETPSIFASAGYGEWFILRTRALQEKLLAADLRAKNIGYCLLLVETDRVYGNRRARVALPLFPGFVFLRGSNDDAYFADRTGRVAQIIPVVDQRRLDLELANLAQVLGARIKVAPAPYVVEGTPATVRSGPLSGIQGFVENRTQRQRLILPVQALRQAITVEVDAAMVQAVA